MLSIEYFQLASGNVSLVADNFKLDHAGLCVACRIRTISEFSHASYCSCSHYTVIMCSFHNIFFLRAASFHWCTDYVLIPSSWDCVSGEGGGEGIDTSNPLYSKLFDEKSWWCIHYWVWMFLSPVIEYKYIWAALYTLCGQDVNLVIYPFHMNIPGHLAWELIGTETACSSCHINLS